MYSMSFIVRPCFLQVYVSNTIQVSKSLIDQDRQHTYTFRMDINIQRLETNVTDRRVSIVDAATC